MPKGFGAGPARQAGVQAMELPAQLGAVAEQAPVLEQPIRELLAASVTGEKKLMFAATNPRITSDPVIGSIAHALDMGRLDNMYKLGQWEEHLHRVVTPVVKIGGSVEDKALASIFQGRSLPGTSEEMLVSSMRNRWLRDFSVQTGDPALNTWSSYSNDLEALYGAYGKAFASDMPEGTVVGLRGSFRTFEQLSEKFKDTMHPAEYSKVLDVMSRRATYAELSETEKKTFETLLNRYKYDTAVPKELADRVPEFFARKYLLSGGEHGDSALQSLRSEIMHFQHQASVERMATTLQPLLDLLPERGGELGSLLAPSRKQYAQRMISQFVYNTRTADEQELGRLFDATNRQLMNPVLEAVGADLRDPLQVEYFRGVTNAIVRGEYRGFLSIDTAMLDLGLGLNTWAETGKFLGPFFRSIAKIDKQGAMRGVPTDLIHERMGYLLESQSAITPVQKLTQLDLAFTQMVMSPLTMMHNLQRGTAFLSGVEKAIQQGVDGQTAIRAGLRGGSSFVEDLTLTRAQMEGFNTMARAAFGFSKLETAPIIQGPLGRLSFMFMHWPNNQAQMIAHGLGRAWSAGDVDGLVRYAALAGMHIGVANWALWSGLDLDKFFLSSNMSYFAVPFWRQVTDAVYTMTGQTKEVIGVTGTVGELRAKERMKDLLVGIAVPQSRALREVADSYKAVAQGYRLDQEGKLMYYTTPWGELLRAVGVRPSEVRVGREAVREMQNRSAIFHEEQRRAIAQMVTEDSMDAALAFEQKYGVPITVEHVQKFMKDSGMLPDERQLKRTPGALRPGVVNLLSNVP